MMNMSDSVWSRAKLAAMAASVLIASGCATLPADRGVGDVNDLLRQRDGVDVSFEQDEALVNELITGPLSADDAVRVAMINSPSIQAALAELEIANAELLEMSSMRNPVFGGEIKFADDGYDPFEFSITQSLLDLIQLPRRRQIGQAEFELAKARTAATLMGLGAQVRSAYWELVAAQAQLGFTQEVADSARVAAEVALRQHEAGTITDLELENQQMLYEQARLDQAEIEERVLVAGEHFAGVIGEGGRERRWSVPAGFPPGSDPLDEEILRQQLAERRLDLLVLRREGDAIARRAGIERWNEIGDVSAGVVVEREHDGERLHGVTASVPIPIFNFGRAAAIRSRAELRRIESLMAAATQQASADLRASVMQVRAARARADYYRDVILPRRERILDLTQLEYNGMLVGIYQLLQARENLLAAHRDYVDAQLGYWTARNSLDQVMSGTGSLDLPSRSERRGSSRPASSGGH